jgi:hypothetical protein
MTSRRINQSFDSILADLHRALIAHIRRSGESGNLISQQTGVSQTTISQFIAKKGALNWNSALLVADYLGRAGHSPGDYSAVASMSTAASRYPATTTRRSAIAFASLM